MSQVPADPAARPDLKALRRRPLFASLWVPLVGLALAGAALGGWWLWQSTTTVIVVRHAEKLADGSADPALSPTGTARVARLAHQLGTSGAAAVYTTPYRRTRDTATGIVQALGLEPVDYDAKDSAALVERILDAHRGQVVVVVGHSNTVGRLVQALGGDAPDEVSEAEYDHLWVVSVPRFGPSATLHLRQL